MDVLSIISKELDFWEEERIRAASEHARALCALETLKKLTDSLRIAAEGSHDQINTFKRS